MIGVASATNSAMGGPLGGKVIPSATWVGVFAVVGSVRVVSWMSCGAWTVALSGECTCQGCVES
eukprot:scaffold4051_cov68-Phaeocystis_antarctica.AAC.3